MEAMHHKTTGATNLVSLQLSDRELEILAGLTDLPDWSEQPEEIGDFLADLHEQLDDALGVDRDDWLGWTSAKAIGFTNETSF